ncbi:uncharacterized protein LOC123306777 [Coccinella septempunctata]|uniref:uncharacterized protein LOC123306777 n=1 Tax=Coccinella septempunctata TaxID=41139 RepID=UPI001D0702E8|nr:uncharacterized protein LOC123306777 [Coccinella septempunctata]
MFTCKFPTYRPRPNMAAASTQLIKNKQVDRSTLEGILGMFWNAEVTVSDVQLEPATSRGNNFISDAWRIKFEHTKKRRPQTVCTVRVEGDAYARKYTTIRRDGIRKSIFVKSRPEDEEHNALMHTDIAFKNEILAYEKVLMALDVYSNGPLRVPTYVYGNPTTVILEDMANKYFECMNRKYVISWNQVWSPIREMAKLHAASIVMKKLNKPYFEEMIKQITQVPLSETIKLAEKQASTIDTTIELLRVRNEPNAQEYIETLKELKEKAWNKQREIINKEAPVMVVNHGNFWINNLLYRNDLSMLLDWQHIVYSSPATDLCFFLYVNFATAFLTNQREALLSYYLMHLHQSIYDVCTERQMNISDIDGLLEPLTYEWIDSELKRCSLCGYMMAQWINPIFYWSEAVFDMMEKVGGMENMSVEQRLENMTSEQKDRVIQLTKVFMNEYREN